MLLFHFLYFGYLLFFIIRRNGFDVSACITVMYAITSFFSIILGFTNEDFGYSNYSKIEISFIPSIIYCLLISACIFPFYRYNSNKQRILLKTKRIVFFDIVAYGYFGVFLLLLLIYKDDLLFRLLFGDMGELRMMYYNGEL